MEKLVLVNHNKYQRLLGALSTKHSTPDSTAFKRKNMPQPPPRKRDMPWQKEGSSMRLYTIKDWISFECNKAYLIPEMTHPCTKEKTDDVL